MPATLVKNCSESVGMLCVAFDLGLSQWSLAFTTGLMQRPREVQFLAGDTLRLIREIAIAKRRFGLPEDAIVVSCYEAGREAFWLHRWLEAQQVRNHVVDSSSIEVNRRQRRGKTDRMDAKKLVKLLVRFCLGEQTVFSVVSVPSIAEEDDRHLHRELGMLTGDETALINRIKGLLAGFGLRLEPNSQFPKQLKKLQQWNGELLPPGVRQRLLCDFAVLQAVRKQIRELERIQKAQIRQDEGPATQQVRKLLGLRGWTENLDGLREGVLRLAAIHQPTSGGFVGRPLLDSLPQRNHAARARDQQSGQSLGPRAQRRTGLVLAALATGQRLEPVVLAALPAWRFAAETDWDRGVSPQTSGRAVEVSGDGHASRGSRADGLEA